MMGLVQKLSLQNYRTIDSVSTPYISTVMPKNTFMETIKNLPFC
jgi:hypothetical protein